MATSKQQQQQPQPPITILDDDYYEDDAEFLSHLEAAEAQALSLSSAAKRRRVDATLTSPGRSTPHFAGEEEAEEEGAYTAALRGSKSLTWQKHSHNLTTQASSNSYVQPHANTGGGGGGACFKCGKDGHWARDCDQTSSSIGAEPGSEKACPCGLGSCLVLTANTERNRGRKFFRCPVRQENGGCDFFEWCDEPSRNRTSGEDRAWKNGSQQQFHQRPATQGISGYTNSYDQGTNSVNSGYGAKFGTTDNKGYSVKPGSSCFKCGEEGHWARDCPATSSNATATTMRGKPSSSGSCYKCGESGHWAKDCSQGQTTRPRNW